MDNWQQHGDFEDVLYHKQQGMAKITINRPERRNAFRPKTINEMMDALGDARMDERIGVIIITGAGDQAFCSGADQNNRGHAGYADDAGGPERFDMFELQRRIRSCPKPVIAMVAGFAVAGGHVLHMVCDLTIAADNAQFGQAGPRVGSFDAGFGAAYMARIVGQKRAREIWFLCRLYDAQKALEMGLVNKVVSLDQLEETTIEWAQEILQKSPLALRCLKAAMNADCDGQAGLSELAASATMMLYMNDEGREGKEAFMEKRSPNYDDTKKFPRRG